MSEQKPPELLYLPVGSIDFVALARRQSLFVSDGRKHPPMYLSAGAQVRRHWRYLTDVMDRTSDQSSMLFPSGIVFRDGSFVGVVKLAIHIQRVLAMPEPPKPKRKAKKTQQKQG